MSSKVEPSVPETLLKKRKAARLSAVSRTRTNLKSREANAKRKEIIFKRVEQYVKEYHEAEREKIRLARLARQNGDYYVPDQAKLAFVIRIKGINKIAPKPRKVLQLMRLLQINNGVFVRLTKPTLQMLKIIDPYVTYGVPNLKSVRELMYKRGFAKINGQRLPLSDNALVEENLGKYSCISIEDIIHEIYTLGPNFKQVNNFLWPFKLSNPNRGWRTRKFKHYIEGGDFGHRGEDINKLIRKMN